jgi:hypothetical protein
MLALLPPTIRYAETIQVVVKAGPVQLLVLQDRAASIRTPGTLNAFQEAPVEEEEHRRLLERPSPLLAQPELRPPLQALDPTLQAVAKQRRLPVAKRQ